MKQSSLIRMGVALLHYQWMITMSFFQVPGNGSPASYLEQAHKEKALQSMQQMSSAQIVSASAIHNKGIPLPTVSDNT